MSSPRAHSHELPVKHDLLRSPHDLPMDVTHSQDEGAYDRYLDQDEWYAQSLARERERLLEQDREKARRREKGRG